MRWSATILTPTPDHDLRFDILPSQKGEDPRGVFSDPNPRQ